MSATAELRRQGGGGAFWILAILLGLGLLCLSSIGSQLEGVTVSSHAEERHGAAALSAEAYLRGGGPFKREPCRDGKEMWTWTQDGKPWLAIVRGDTIITLFETTQDYLQRVRLRDGCGDGLHWGTHDMPSAQ